MRLNLPRVAFAPSLVRFVVRLFCTALVPIAIDASELRVVPMIEGRNAIGAQVCVFRGNDAALPLDRFLTGDDVRCYAADRAVELPAGFWNYFVVDATGSVSSHPLGVLIAKESTEPAHAMRVPLIPAGILDLSAASPALGEGEYLAVYCANETQPLS